LFASAGLTVLHRPPSLPLKKGAAIAAVLRDAGSRRLLKQSGWDSAKVTAVDGSLERASFFAGSQIVLDAAVRRDGVVVQDKEFRRGQVGGGSPTSHAPLLLALCCLLFALMTAVAPLWRVRNLDVLALVSFVVPVVLLDHRLLLASVLTSYPPLVYLAVRCAWIGLARETSHAPQQPLFDRITGSWSERRRARSLRLGLYAFGLAVAMVSVTSPGIIDVGSAVMEGATRLLHGVLPYGHMPGDIIHGDTYPPLSYALYTPAALILPVRDVWDDATGALLVATAAALLAARGTGRLSTGRTGRAKPLPDIVRVHETRGALALLAFPPMLITVSSGTSDIVLAVLLAWSVLWWRYPGRSALLVTAAGWFKLAPFALLPLWLARFRGRDLGRALLAALGLSATIGALLLALGGTAGIAAMMHAVAFQFQRQSLQSLWTLGGLQPLQPLIEGSVLGLLAAGTMRVRLEPRLAADPSRIAALAAAVLLGAQISANYWTYTYLAWVLPCLAAAMLTDRLPSRAVSAGRTAGP
jgi:hypothetical protein